jgi:peptidase M28-like protein/immune inhibitor InhA-like protein/type IX secretion system substrate protein
MRYLSNIILLFLIFATLLFADKKHSNPIPYESNLKLVVDPFIQNIVNQVSGDSILAYLQQLESLGLKNPGSTELEDARDWLSAKYQSYGYTDVVYHDFSYSSFTLQNIVVTKTGTVQPDVTLIIDGHYDTIGGPGVNDNGSGVAVILEVARLLANIDCQYTIKFINFSAEEQGLVGSSAYVTNVAVPQNMNILLVFNIDEVGGDAALVNNTITCERDEGSPTGNNAASAAYTDTLATITQEYSTLNTQIAHAYGSDYMPFEDAGFVITGYYETNESTYPHGPNDILANMDPAYVTEITKGAVAAALHFAKARSTYLSLNHQPIITSQDTLNPYDVNVEAISSSAINLSKCYYRLNSGGFSELNMSLASTISDTMIYNSAIPAQNYNNIIDYYFTFENIDSVSTRLPETAGTYFQFEISPDTVAPAVNHLVLHDQSYLINPIDFSVTAADDNGISDVVLQIIINNGVINEYDLSWQGNDDFSYLFTDILSASDSIYYRFKAIDNSANKNVTWLPSSGYYTFEVLNSELFNFENHNDLFAGTGDWQWGELTDTSIPQPTENYVWATTLSGNYSNNTNSELVTPFIDLSNKYNAKLVINHFYQIEPINDGANIKISTDSLNFQVINPIAGYPYSSLPPLTNEPGYSHNSYFWVEDEFDLSSYSDQNIQLKFDFRSDIFTNQKGWYIDYVRLDFRGEVSNHAPQIVYYFPQNLDSLEINSQQSFSFRAEDSDSDSLTYSLTHKEQVVNDSAATFTFTEAGFDTVYARVEDGKGKLDAYEWIIYINDPASDLIENPGITKKYYLYPASPNPFNPTTNITYELKEPGNIEINVYTISGQKIETLKNGYLSAGKYKIEFNGSKYSSGIYIIEMKTNNFHFTRKALLIK